MPKYIYITVIFILLFITNRTATAQEISLCENEIPPWVIAKDGQISDQSLLTIFTDAVFAEIDELTVKYILLPWSRCQKLVQQGKIDGTLFMSITDERREIYQFSNSTIEYPEGLLYSMNKHPNGLYINGEADLKKYRIGLLRGHTYVGIIGDMLDKGIFDHEIVNDSEQNYKKLMAGRIDLLVEGIVNARYDLKIKGLHNKIGINKGTLIFNGDMAYGFNKQSPVLKYLPEINKVIDQLREKGLHTELLNKSY